MLENFLVTFAIIFIFLLYFFSIFPVFNWAERTFGYGSALSYIAPALYGSIFAAFVVSFFLEYAP